MNTELSKIMTPEDWETGMEPINKRNGKTNSDFFQSGKLIKKKKKKQLMGKSRWGKGSKSPSRFVTVIALPSFIFSP